MKKNRIKISRQLEANDCGPACLHMIAALHGRNQNQRCFRRNNPVYSPVMSVANCQEMGMQDYSLREIDDCVVEHRGFAERRYLIVSTALSVTKCGVENATINNNFNQNTNQL